MRHVHAAGGEAGYGAALQTQHSLAVFVATTITGGGHAEAGGHALHLLPHEPQQDVQRVRAQVAEAPDARLEWIGHPAPLRVEPAL